ALPTPAVVGEAALLGIKLAAHAVGGPGAGFRHRAVAQQFPAEGIVVEGFEGKPVDDRDAAAGGLGGRKADIL
nr:hypothetical protein [Tanacetum cinerariifolium]